MSACLPACMPPALTVVRRSRDVRLSGENRTKSSRTARNFRRHSLAVEEEEDGHWSGEMLHAAAHAWTQAAHASEAPSAAATYRTSRKAEEEEAEEEASRTSGTRYKKGAKHKP